MSSAYTGPERREFVRLDYIAPLAYKICKKETVTKLLKGYTTDISQAGLLCNIKEKVKPEDILWLSFDRATLSICEEVEKNCLIYQNGIVGKVVRIEPKPDQTFNVGLKFIVREEKNLTHIYPKIHFLKDHPQQEAQYEEEEDNEEL